MSSMADDQRHLVHYALWFCRGVTRLQNSHPGPHASHAAKWLQCKQRRGIRRP